MQGLADATAASLVRAFRQHDPTHAAMVLEDHDRTWRHLLYAGYKANRSETPAELIEALPQIRDRIRELGVNSISVPSYEADDVIATLADVVASHKGEVVILSTDKIFLQLLGPNVTVFDHFNGVHFDPRFVRDRYGIEPDQYVDYLALVGDRSNNVQGVTGIGPKSAVQLLTVYPGLDAVLQADADDRLVNKVQQASAEADLCRMLVSLKRDVALGTNLRSFRLGPVSH